MPRLATETIGTGDQSWLASTHAIWQARSVAPDPEKFSTDAFEDGYVPSGTLLAVVDGKAVPFDPEGEDGSELFFGMLFTDQKLPAEGSWPVLWHCAVKSAALPAAAKAAAELLAGASNPAGQVTFVDLAMTTPAIEGSS